MALTDTVALSLLDVLAQPTLSRFVGRCSDMRLPKPLLQPLLKAYIRAFRVDMSDVAQPIQRFRSFDEFFTRRLRPGARPIAGDEQTLVSPADGHLLNSGHITRGRLLQVKGIEYTVEQLLDDTNAARRYDGGSFFTIYLSPSDYHRVHTPLGGEVTGYRYVPGKLYPVNSLGVNRVDGIFYRNERLTTYLRTPLGHAAVVMVGATSVGRISVTYDDVRTNEGADTPQAVYYARPRAVSKGAELGTFHLGSTVVLLIEPPALTSVPGLEPGQALRVGETLARLA